MKIFLCLLIISCTVLTLKGQALEKSAYVGISLGTSLLLNSNDPEGRVGVNLNLINAGYSFKNNFGVALKWMGAGHSFERDSKIGYGAILIGPMYSIPVTERTCLDLKIASGLFWITEEIKYFTTDPNDPTIVDAKQSVASLSFGNFAAGMALRHHFAKHWSLLILADYNSGKHAGSSYYINGKYLQALNVNAGIAVRI